jgi:hypothetical protein
MTEATAPSLNYRFPFICQLLDDVTCSPHEERALDTKVPFSFSRLAPDVTNMHLHFPCNLQARRDLGTAAVYAPPNALRGPHSPSDRE